ncbi:MAG: hypothetical protein IPL17_13560 [Anaerolineales bacterium]|nr:hypothetical protein [Anaerolineales bacterium]
MSIAVHADGVYAIAIPVSDNRLIARCAEGDDQIGIAVSIGVAQVEGAVAVDADRGSAVAVPVTRNGIISRSTVVDGDICKT